MVKDKLFYIINSSNQAKPMFNFNQLESMISNQKAIKAAHRMTDLYPVDGEKDPNQVLRHDSSQQIHALVKNKKEKGKIKQKIPEIYQDLLSLSLCETKKSVCAKIIHAGDTVVECLDCRADPSCIICMDCYKNGDHKGHRVFLKKGFGGCCDCGD